MKRQRFYCFISFAQNADIHLSGKRRNSTTGQKWEDKYLYNGQLSTSRCIKIVIIFQQHFVFNIDRDRRISPIIPENWEHYQIQSRLEVTVMHAGNRCWQIMTSKPRGTAANEMNKEDPTQGILVWYQPFAVNQEDLEAYVLAHSPERANNVHVYIYSASRKVWWLDYSRAQNPQRWTWISEQSPIRCRGTSSRHSMESVSNQKLHRRRRRIFESFQKPSQKPKVIHTHNSLEFGKYGEEWSWNHRTITLHRSKTSEIAEGAVRRAKEETSAVLLQSGSDDKWWSDSMTCCCYLRDDQDLLADGKSQNERRFGESFQDMNLFAVWIFWEEDILMAEIEELEKLDASDIYPRRLNAKKVLITKKWRICISRGSGSAKISGIHRKERDLSGESHGDREEFQPEETKDDEGINKDFWAHAEARKECHVSSSYWTEKFN